MDINLNDYIDRLQTSVSVVYECQDIAPTGGIAIKCVEPIDAPNHTRTFITDNTDLVLTVPIPEIEITPEIDTALWKSLENSSVLISKGRLVT